jgi:hypothetical protein
MNEDQTTTDDSPEHNAVRCGSYWEFTCRDCRTKHAELPRWSDKTGWQAILEADLKRRTDEERADPASWPTAGFPDDLPVEEADEPPPTEEPPDPPPEKPSERVPHDPMVCGLEDADSASNCPGCIDLLLRTKGNRR